MRSHMVLIALLASLCIAWVFPRHLPDGLYHITLPHEDDKEAKPLVRRAYELVDDELLHEADNAAKHGKRGWYEDDSILNTEAKHEDKTYPKRPYEFKDEQLLIHEAPPKYPPEGAPPTLRPHDIPGDYGDLPVRVSHWDCNYSTPPYEPTDYEIARDNLGSYCTRWEVNKRTAHISAARRGEVVVYVCNYSHFRQPCSRRQLDWLTEHFLDHFCGEGTPAWAYSMEDHMSYGRGWIGQELCEMKVGIRNPPVTKVVWAGRPPDWGSYKNKPPWHKNIDKHINWIPEANGHTDQIGGFRAEWEFPGPDGGPDKEVPIVEKVEGKPRGPYLPTTPKDRIEAETAQRNEKAKAEQAAKVAAEIQRLKGVKAVKEEEDQTRADALRKAEEDRLMREQAQREKSAKWEAERKKAKAEKAKEETAEEKVKVKENEEPKKQEPKEEKPTEEKAKEEEVGENIQEKIDKNKVDEKKVDENTL
ncbi:hypothetical protein EDB80DRAFT_812919 [Ilyonectria destructans]|nr:hypothetical protein EDB80DRAFT_812919 [Ilyonectria destructans]